MVGQKQLDVTTRRTGQRNNLLPTYTSCQCNKLLFQTQTRFHLGLEANVPRNALGKNLTPFPFKCSAFGQAAVFIGV